MMVMTNNLITVFSYLKLNYLLILKLGNSSIIDDVYDSQSFLDESSIHEQMMLGQGMHFNNASNNTNVNRMQYENASKMISNININHNSNNGNGSNNSGVSKANNEKKTQKKRRQAGTTSSSSSGPNIMQTMGANNGGNINSNNNSSTYTGSPYVNGMQQQQNVSLPRIN